MPVRVLKFGGTSVETPNHILAVARRILAYREAGDPIVVVVSAMGQATDELIRLARRVSRSPVRRELDMLLTAGERISMSLLAMSLESLGCPAISFTGSQSGIVTDTHHADARILSVRAFRIRQELEKGRVVIVAGFQGVSREKEITTLGRGGSDTTAVALAIHLGAGRSEIFTDVPGVLTADPRIVPGARKLERLGFEPMIVLSHLGGRVLFRRAVILARKFGLPVEVRTSLTPESGTMIAGAGTAPPRAGFEEESMETNRVMAVALESPVHWVRVELAAESGESVSTSSPESAGLARPTGHPFLPDTGSPLFLHYSRTFLPSGSHLVQFVIAPGEETEPVIETAPWGAGSVVTIERHAALVSLVGEGVLSDAEHLRRAGQSLIDAGVPVWASFSGTLSLSFIVPEEQGEAATRALHRDLIEGSAS